MVNRHSAASDWDYYDSLETHPPLEFDWSQFADEDNRATNPAD